MEHRTQQEARKAMPRITIRHRATALSDRAEPIWRAQLEELGEILAQSAATRRPSRDSPRAVERLATRVADLLAA